jgi:hypothetical protein
MIFHKEILILKAFILTKQGAAGKYAYQPANLSLKLL